MPIWDFESDDESNVINSLLRIGSDAVGNVLGGVGSGISTGLELLSRPNRAVRTALFDSQPEESIFDTLGRGLQTPTGANGGVMDSGASALEQYGMGTQQIAGPIDTRGVAGFGLDIVTDPLSLIPMGKIGKFAGQALGMVDNALPQVARGLEVGLDLGVDDLLVKFRAQPSAAVETARWVAEHAKIAPIMRLFDPTLVPEGPLKQVAIAYAGALENTENAVVKLSARYLNDAPGLENRLMQLFTNSMTELETAAPAAAKYFGKKDLDLNNPTELIQTIHQMDFVRNISPMISQMDMVAVGAARQEVKSLSRDIINVTKIDQQVGVALQQGQLPDDLLRAVGKIDPKIRTALEDFYTSPTPTPSGTLDPRAMLQDAGNALTQQLFVTNNLLGQLAGPSVGKQVLKESYPYLPNMWFTTEQAAELTRALSNRPPSIIAGISEVSGVFRTLEATLDLSAPFIQGLVTLFAHPTAFVRGVAGSIEELVTPGSLLKYMSQADNQALYAEVKGLATGNTGNELFEGIATLAAITKSTLPDPIKPLGSLVDALGKGMQRSEGAFSAFGTIARTEWGKAVIGNYRDAGKLPEMADMLNHATGVYMSRQHGVSATQAAIESGILFFAPRYTRSAVALVADMAQGGMVGQDIAKNLGSMLVGGVAGYIHFANLLNQKPILDPKDSRFLSVDVDGSRVGIGSVWTSMARLVAVTAADPASLGMESVSNPLMRWWRGRSSPLSSFAVDLADQQTFTGTPLTSFGSRALRAIALITPINLQGLLTDIGAGNVPGLDPEARTTGTIVAAGLVGLHGSPERPMDLYESLAKSTTGKSFQDLDPIEQARVRNLPEVKALPTPPGREFQSFRDSNKIMMTYTSHLDTAAQSVKDGSMTKVAFRDAEMRLSDIRDAQLEMVPKSKVATAKQDPREDVRKTYISMFKPDPVTGKVDYDQPESFLATQDAATQKYIADKRSASLEYLSPEARELMKDLQAARTTLAPYWEIQDEVLRRYNLLEKFKNADSVELAALKKTTRYKAAEDIWDKRRLAMRRRDSQVDKYLVDWYGRVPIAQQGR